VFHRYTDYRRFGLNAGILDVLPWNSPPCGHLPIAGDRQRTTRARSAHDQHREGDLAACINITLSAGGVTPTSAGTSCAKISNHRRRSCATTASTAYTERSLGTQNKTPSDNDYKHRHLGSSKYGCVTWRRPSRVIGRRRAASERAEHFRNLLVKYRQQACAIREKNYRKMRNRSARTLRFFAWTL